VFKWQRFSLSDVREDLLDCESRKENSMYNGPTFVYSLANIYIFIHRRNDRLTHTYIQLTISKEK